MPTQATVAAGMEYLLWFLPGLGLQFVMSAMGATLRGLGLEKPSMMIQIFSVTLNAVAGQNFGAGLVDRVRETFRTAFWLGSVVMIALTLLCQIRPDWLIRFFTSDADVVAVGAEFLRIISWNFVASGLIFTCSGMFQALGNTLPALQSSASRLLTFVLPAVLLSAAPWFELRHLWYLSVVSVGSQALLSLWLLRRTMRRKLQAAEPEPSAAVD